MSGERLTDDALRAMLDAATPGPWCRELAQDGEILPDGSGYAGDWYTTNSVCTLPCEQNEGETEPVADAYRPSDADLIAAAPDLAREVLELRAEVERLRAELAKPVAGPWVSERWLEAPVSGPITAERLAAATEIVALPGWRWTRGLHSVRGLVVRVDPDGVPVVRTLEDEQIVEILWDDQMVQRNGTLLPDPADPLLPGWLLHLLRERAGDQTVSARHMPYYSVWWVCGLADRPDESRVYGEGPTEIDALLSALQGVGS